MKPLTGILAARGGLHILVVSLAATAFGAPGCATATTCDEDFDTAAGLHTTHCYETEWTVAIPEACPADGCGLIIDVHGYGMNADMQERNTLLRRKGPARGYIVMQPTAPERFIVGRSWDNSDPEHVRLFVERAIRNLPVDANRVHATGFSQGGSMTWQLVCTSHDLFASAAPAAAAAGCDGSIDSCLLTTAEERPDIDILFMLGTTDIAVNEECADAQVGSVLESWDMRERDGTLVDRDGVRTRTFTSERNNTFAFVEHDFEGDPALQGHCIPGSEDTAADPPDHPYFFGCLDETSFVWGDAVLDFFDRRAPSGA